MYETGTIKDVQAGVPEAVVGALLHVYEYQTQDERLSGATRHLNGCGFDGTDSVFLSSLSKQYINKGFLTEKQISSAKKAVLKYQRQYADGFTKLPIKPPERKTKETTPMKVVESAEGANLTVSFQYDADLVRKIKSLPVRRYISDTKTWVVPNDKIHREALEKIGFTLPKEEEPGPVQEEPMKERLKKVLRPGVVPFPYQVEGVSFLEKQKGKALLADEMGLGKTLEAISWLALNQEKAPFLVVCPASLKSNWHRECQKFAGFHCTILSGKYPTPILHDSKVYIINYDILDGLTKKERQEGKTNWADELLRMKFGAIVVDESHYIKSDKTKRTKAVRRLAGKIPHKIFITGTPILSRPIELYSTLNILDPLTWGNWFRFALRYCDAKNNGFGLDVRGSSNTQELNEILTNSIMIRRLKKDVLKDLPDMSIHITPFDISNRRQYEKAVSDFKSWLAERFTDEKVARTLRAETLTKIGYLKRLAAQGKIDDVCEWISNFLDSDKKLVVFAIHKDFIEEVKKRFQKVCVVIDGSVPTNKRQELVDRFQTDNNVRLMIGNMQAAGVGLTMTAADTVAFLELGWNPADHSQAAARIHRIGQESSKVDVYYLVAENTIEEDVIEALSQKDRVVTSVLEGTEVKEEDVLSNILHKFGY